MPRFDVTIAGELNLDLILYGLPEQLQPERELLADRMMLTLGASSAIVAHNLSALGSRVGFQSRIGDDPLGALALERLQQGGVDTSRVRHVPGAITTGLTVILHHQSWRNILTYAGTIAELKFEDLDLDYLVRLPPLPSLLVLPAARVASQDRRAVPVLKVERTDHLLDTNDDPEDLWEGNLKDVLQYVDVFLPNEREACKAAGTDDLQTAIRKLSDLVPLLVVKMGRQGAIAQRGSERFTSPPNSSTPSIPWAQATASTPASSTSTCEVPISLPAWRLATWLAPSPQLVPEELKRFGTLSTAHIFDEARGADPSALSSNIYFPLTSSSK